MSLVQSQKLASGNAVRLLFFFSMLMINRFMNHRYVQQVSCACTDENGVLYMGSPNKVSVIPWRVSPYTSLHWRCDHTTPLLAPSSASTAYRPCMISRCRICTHPSQLVSHRICGPKVHSNQLFTASSHSVVMAWDTQTQSQVHEYKRKGGEEERATCLAMDPTGAPS